MISIKFGKKDIEILSDNVTDGEGPYVYSYLLDTKSLNRAVDEFRKGKGYKTISENNDLWYDFIVDIPCEKSVDGTKMYVRVTNAEDEEDNAEEYNIKLSNGQKRILYDAVKEAYEKWSDESWTFERYLKDLEDSYRD